MYWVFCHWRRKVSSLVKHGSNLPHPHTPWAGPRLSMRKLFPCQMLPPGGVKTRGLLRRKNICLQWVKVMCSGHHRCGHYCEVLKKEVLQREQKRKAVTGHPDKGIAGATMGHSLGKFSLAVRNVSQENGPGFAANSYTSPSSNG